MAQKRYGPVLGPGVVVLEREAGGSIQPAPFGVTGFVGVLEKGEVGKLLSCYSLRDFRKKCGGRIAESYVPDAAEDFFNHSGGAGELHLVRVTDGTEVQAECQLYSRQPCSTVYNGTNYRSPVVKLLAKSGGRWGGRLDALAGAATSVTATTFATGATMLLNEWKGATVKFELAATKTYTVVSNTIAGVVTVNSDATIATDIGGATGDYCVELARDTARELSAVVGNGEVDPDNLWSLRIYADGDPVLYYPNLSMDPTSKYYFVNVINDDQGNDEVIASDLNTGGNYTAARRPASEYGTCSAASSGTTQACTVHNFYRTVGSSTATLTLGTPDANMKYRAKLKIVVLAGNTTANYFISFCNRYDAWSAWTQVAAAATVANAINCSALFPTVQLTGVVASGDNYIVEWNPFEPDALKGWNLYPNVTDALYKNTKYRITGNTVNTITVSQTINVANGNTKEYRVESPVPFTKGYDGGTPTEGNYTSTFDAGLSLFNDLIGMNKGLVRLACPGNYATAVVKAGLAYAEAKNWMYRADLDPAIITEDAAVAAVIGSSGCGRSDFGVLAFPSWGYVADPDRAGLLKRIPLTGAIMGREAAVARNYEGYHKAPAGIDFVLSRVLKLDTKNLNEEVLNPMGINVVKISKGNCIVWGARTISSDSAWKWLHQRAMMSHYEHILQENFDWTIFKINDPTLQAQLVSSLRAYFIPEWRKRALRGDTFEEACSIKVDSENNTDLTRAAGELYAEIGLQLADTVERLIIVVSKDGVFEQTA